MKNIFFAAILLIGVLLFSCEEELDVAPPIAGFEVSDSVVGVGQSVIFRNNSISEEAEYLWDFGDDNTSVEFSPVHKYQEKGNYMVSLSVKNAAGKDLFILENGIEVGYLPSTYYEIDETEPFYTGKPISFTNKSLNEVEIESIYWNFANGDTSVVSNPKYTYKDDGTYLVALTMVNKYGDSTYTRSLSVKGLTIADFNCLRTAVIGEKVQFEDLSSHSPSSWEWSFGDNQGSNSQNPIHVYMQKGKYTVTLLTVNENGQSYVPKKITINVESLSDIDGNEYPITKIGSQVWMADNLKVTHYPDSTPIDYVADTSSFPNLNNDDAVYHHFSIGTNNWVLYTFAAVVNEGAVDDSSEYMQGVCPTGWQVASWDDWEILKDHVVSEGHVEWGQALKASNGWSSNEQNGTDVYGFSMLPNKRSDQKKTKFASFWTPKNNSSGYYGTNWTAYSLYFDFHEINSGYSYGFTAKENTFGVRCVRDKLVD